MASFTFDLGFGPQFALLIGSRARGEATPKVNPWLEIVIDPMKPHCFRKISHPVKRKNKLPDLKPSSITGIIVASVITVTVPVALPGGIGQ